jgi:hypothetical protein
MVAVSVWRFSHSVCGDASIGDEKIVSTVPLDVEPK